MIGEDAIVGWRNRVPWRDDTQVEQDLLLHAMIQKIYANPFLAEKLAFRGGTCLNKLFWSSPARYSEDLDFVQTTAEKIGPTVKELRNAMASLFGENPKWKPRRGSFRLYYSFVPEARPIHPQRIKIEINTREHVAIEGYQKKKFTLDSVWLKGEAEVTTFSIEELLATKLRALFQRSKGRDLFDLWKSQEIKPDYKKVVNFFVEYCQHLRKPIHRESFLENLDQKLADRGFLEDIGPLLVPGTDYDVIRAADFVRDEMMPLLPLSKARMKKLGRKI
ncbi:MAG: nucleotidyl transferase AbiEii/AbiGii toxin family protein [Deltaproteobacteria bacterium]|nr:nucleotidyl transferase AbiEii/AbiGii toxin family protein [Deltaproteobacteria bacterium]